MAQNHRGHESYGFLTHSEGLRRYVDLGLVPRIERQEFLRWNILLPGNVGIAHVRYGTSGHRNVYAHLRDAQPIVVSRGREKLGLAYNGNLVNIGWLKEFVASRNGRLKTTSDTELLSRYLLDNMDRGIMDSVRLCMENVEGAFSVVGLRSSGEFFAFRDPLGMRPLCLGQSRDGNIKAVSSETVGLDINDFQVINQVEPGEVLLFTKDGMERQRLVKDGRREIGRAHV